MHRTPSSRPRLARRVVHRLLVAGGVAGVLLATFAPVSHAATVEDAGWWDRNNGVPLGGAAPPAEGALRVANDPTGPSAVSAVRVQLDPGEKQPTLVLRVTGDPAPATAGFLACAPEKPWTGDDGGPWGERPVADCDAGRAGGRVSADGTTVSFDLSILRVGDVVDVVIGPVATAGNPVGDTFVVDFAAPTGGDVTTNRTPATTTTTTTAPAPDFSSGPIADPSPASGGFTPPPNAGVPATIPAAPVTTVAPTADDAPAPTISPDDSGEEIAAGTPVEDPEGNGRRLAGAGIATVIAGVGAYLWNSERNKIVVAGPTIGGLGAFRRERTEPAPDVS